MPATFQDAIYIARKLGIRYLWIDALCIVQDDMDDWEAEAVAMCDVFAHSQITISAAKSSSSAESFLQRAVDERLTLRFRSTLKPEIFGEYFIRLDPRYIRVHYLYQEQEDVKNSAWASRAWVWQEEVISTRQIVFGEKSVQFRCSVENVLEDGRCGPPSSGPLPFLLADPTDSWTGILEEYSSRVLTHPKDRLKAIAGVAEFIASSLRTQGKPTDYLAGLWKHDRFPKELCWICKHPTSSRTELLGHLRDEERYIAPSWSWASRDAGVGYLITSKYRHSEIRAKPAIRVINWDLEASHANAMVSVAFGSSITLSGRCGQLPVELSGSRRGPNEKNWPDVWEAFTPHGMIEFWLDWVPKMQDPEHVDLESRLLLFFTSEDSWNEAESSVLGLVLLPVDDSAVMLYYRVGVFEYFGDTRWLESLPERVISIR